MLLGRAKECAALSGLVEDMRRGGSRTLVVRGEAGIGKTALLEYATGLASDATVIRAVGVEAEMELAYASLHQLCGPLLDRLELLPGPQRHALEVVFGLSDGDAPDRFLVGLAVLGLLSELSAERPVLALIDDAQWLDQTSALTLAFVARRVLAERVGLVFAVRGSGDAFRHLPELALVGLRNGDARRVLRSAVRFRLDDQVVDRIVAETRGNPLALVELPRGLSATELAGFGTGAISASSNGIEESFRRRLAALPEDTRRLLLVAAAEPLGEPTLVWRAAEQQGVGPAAAAPAAEAGLCEFGARVRFRHPLVRAAAYGAASPDERREAHAAIAEATDAEADPDRRAWHRARASAGPDDAVADELERSRIACAGARGRSSRGGLPGALGRADTRSRASRRPRARRGRGQALRRARGGRAAARRGRRARSARRARTARASTRCAAAWRPCSAAPATRRRCCSARPGGSSDPTAASLARRIGTRSSRPSMPGAYAGDTGIARAGGGDPLGGAVDRPAVRERRAAGRGGVAGGCRLSGGRGGDAERTRALPSAAGVERAGAVLAVVRRPDGHLGLGS